ALARAIAETDPDGIGIIVSSDMNHYESEETTLEKDKIALAQVAAENPGGLLEACRRHHVTMCGCSPMALALWCVQALRREGEAVPKPAVVVHDSSGRVSRDHAHVVGYAGCHVF
ncbi:MAG: AmmeMemoRadiSam system protein B, partial [Desulfovibrio sp.]|nr:AmmeMemoRadiSam system protein B [Desulfovibrio sp.]